MYVLVTHPCIYRHLGTLDSREVLVDVLPGVGKQTLEGVPGPLEGVLDGVGEVLEGADGNGFLGGVLRGAVALGHVRKDHLRAHRSKDRGASIGLLAQSKWFQCGEMAYHNACTCTCTVVKMCLYYRIFPSKHPWVLEIHEPANGGGCLH